MILRPLCGIGAALLILVAAAGCGKKQEAAPQPKEVSGDSIAEFCNMAVTEHTGPKGQIFVRGRREPFWFASVRDTFAFTMLPEEPKAIAAIYVNDMAKAKSWDEPGPGTWIEARSAWYVIGSRKKSGMGEDEAAPFADEQAAKAFVSENGGRIVRFADMPRDYILPSGDVAPGAEKKMDPKMDMDMKSGGPSGDPHPQEQR